MKIDTHYGAGTMLCTIELDADDEGDLGDDLLARVACNQHRLVWHDPTSGVARLGTKDPSTFRIPSGYRRWKVQRDGRKATVTFEVAS